MGRAPISVCVISIHSFKVPRRTKRPRHSEIISNGKPAAWLSAPGCARRQTGDLVSVSGANRGCSATARFPTPLCSRWSVRNVKSGCPGSRCRCSRIAARLILVRHRNALAPQRSSLDLVKSITRCPQHRRRRRYRMVHSLDSPIDREPRLPWGSSRTVVGSDSAMTIQGGT